MTAMRASVFDCDNLTNAWVANRHGGSHIDVADLITNFGSAPRASLEMLCESAGIPLKGNGHGCDVADMLRVEGIEALKNYCEEDVASTIVLFDVREQVLADVFTTAIIANRHLISAARVSGDVYASDAFIFAELAAACPWSKWLNMRSRGWDLHRRSQTRAADKLAA